MRRALCVILPAAAALMMPTPAAFSAEKSAPGATNATSPPKTAPGPEGAKHVTPDLKLGDADREAVKKAILGANTHQPTPAKFEPQVGAAVPKTIYVHGMPQDVIRDRPALKQFMYAHLDRAILLIDAVQKKVAEVIPLTEAEWNTAHPLDAKKADVAAVGGLPQLDPAKKQAIYGMVASQNPQPVPAGEPMRAGAEAPASLQLAPLPQQVGAAAPDLAGKQFAMLQDGRLLIVDPTTRKVAGVITKDEGMQTAESGSQTGPARDAIRANEKAGGPSAYTGPGSMGQTNSSGGDNTGKNPRK